MCFCYGALSKPQLTGTEKENLHGNLLESETSHRTAMPLYKCQLSVHGAFSSDHLSNNIVLKCHTYLDSLN